jgi:hypothetical protein
LKFGIVALSLDYLEISQSEGRTEKQVAQKENYAIRRTIDSDMKQLLSSWQTGELETFLAKSFAS